ncbi:MAG: ribulokinase [Puia sp.]|nr:ribulokinase [Puia sp.]
MIHEELVIGVDFGTDSVRSILVNTRNGLELASSIFFYPRWKDGLYCDPASNRFRQHPLDYIEGLEHTVKNCVAQAGANAKGNIKAISIDTTGSTPVAVDPSGTPLGLIPGFTDNPNALFVLWKDHTAVQEAAAINAHATTSSSPYLQFVGGIYSSEWFWAKLLHVLREDASVRKACYSWVEHCDWIPFLLTGGKQVETIKRGVCAAGHKALWAAEFGGLPPDAFFTGIDPLLEGFTKRLFTKTYTADQPAGTLSKEWSDRLGLTESVIVGVGAFDAHMGAVGGQIEPYHLSKVMGTSTCDMLVAPIRDVEGRLVKGICGQVPGSVIPGMMGMEAGQSAFGDAYAWFRNLLSWPLQELFGKSDTLPANTTRALVEETFQKILPTLSRQADTLPILEYGELAVDWFNGRRTPDANQLLKGAVMGLGLGSDAPRIFRAIAESTCFGARAIVDRFMREGIPVKGLIGLGGVTGRSPFIMQMMADILDMPIRIHRSEQTCALGAAMFAATAAGIYKKVEDAMQIMGQGFDREFHPDPARVPVYANRYRQYEACGKFLEAAETTQYKVSSSASRIALSGAPTVSSPSTDFPAADPSSPTTPVAPNTTPESDPVSDHSPLTTDHSPLTTHSSLTAPHDKYRSIREAAYEANMELPRLKLVLFTFGNVSAADRGLGVFAIKPSGVPYKDLSPEKMVVVDFEGRTISGSLRPSSDTQTHALLYKHWLSIGGIAHTHSTFATAWAQSQRSIPLYGTTHADHNTGDIPCAPPMNDDRIQGDYEYQTGLQIIEELRARRLSYEDLEMILVGNHAPFTWGNTAAKAVYNSAVLESIAQMAYLTEQIRQDCPRLKDSLVKKHYDRKHGPGSYYGQP